MPAKTTTDAKKVVDATAKAMGDAATKTQEQYLTVLEQSQSLALESYEAWLDAVRKIEVPGLDTVAPALDAMKVPAETFDGVFDFTAAVLENQKQFASKMLAVATKA